MMSTSSLRLSPGRFVMEGTLPWSGIVRTVAAMIREDYIMRLIRQIAEAVARMIRRRESGDLEAALRDADALFDLLEIPRELCDVVDTPTLAGLLRDPERMRLAARVFWEEGHVVKAMGDPLGAFARYRRALELILEARAAGPEHPDDAPSILELSRLVPAAHLDARYRV